MNPISSATLQTVTLAREPAALRVLHVVEATLAGVGRHVLDLCEGLRSEGHEVHLVYSTRRMDEPFRARVSALDDVSRAAYDMDRSPGLADVAAVRFVRDYLRRHGPFSLVHGHSSKGGAVARIAGASLGLPAVYTPNGIGTMNPQLGRGARWMVGAVERSLARVPGTIVAVSPEEREHILGLGVPPERVVVVPNAIPAVRLPSKREARRELGLGETGVVLGFVGRLERQKAPDVLLESFARLVAAEPDVHLAVVGTGSMEGRLRARAGELGIAPRVHWLGHRDGQRSMAAFDVFVLPSRYEGMPYVLLEALAAGLPIVTTTAAGARVLVDPGVNGEVVTPERPDALADALLRYVRDPAARERAARQARGIAARYTLPRMVGETAGVYCGSGAGGAARPFRNERRSPRL